MLSFHFVAAGNYLQLLFLGGALLALFFKSRCVCTFYERCFIATIATSCALKFCTMYGETFWKIFMGWNGKKSFFLVLVLIAFVVRGKWHVNFLRVSTITVIPILHSICYGLLWENIFPPAELVFFRASFSFYWYHCGMHMTFWLHFITFFGEARWPKKAILALCFFLFLRHSPCRLHNIF